MKKLLAVLNAVALVVTIVINYLSNTGYFNEATMASVSAEFSSYMTPASYAFSIWGLIYLSLIGFVIFQGRVLADKVDAGVLVDQVGWWFFISCAANSCWVLAWLYGYTGLSVLIMLVLFFSLLKIVWRTDMELTDPPFSTVLFVWWPFCLYGGWISVAFFADLSAWLVKIQWSGFGIHMAIWSVIMILVAGALHLYMTWRRNMREFGFVGVWALIAIGVGNEYRAHAVEWAAFFVAAVLLISSSIHGYRNRKYAPWRRRTVG